MYSFIRIGITVIFVTFYIILQRLRKPKPKSKKILYIIGGLFLLGLLFLPFESLVLRFESPNAAFSYTSSDKVIDIYNNNDYAAVLHQKNDGSWGFTVLKKDRKGWIIDNPSFMNNSHTIKVDQYLIDYQLITATTMFVYLNKLKPNEPITVQSEDGNEFRLFAYGDKTFRFNIYYGFVQFNNGYIITVDGKKLRID